MKVSPASRSGLPSRTRSRPADGTYTLGVLVQANHGNRSDLLIRGVPVGRELPLSEIPHYRDGRGLSPFAESAQQKGTVPFSSRSSILIMIGTDAPLLPHQLKRLARRATLGLGRTGTVGNNGSGDIFLAFSTARGLSPFAQRGLSPFVESSEQKGTVPFSVAARGLSPNSPSPLTGEGRGEGGALPSPQPLTPSPQPLASIPFVIPNGEFDPLFEATTEATEEAIINALIAAENMTGRDHHTAYALPHPRLQEIMRKYSRFVTIA